MRRFCSATGYFEYSAINSSSDLGCLIWVLVALIDSRRLAGVLPFERDVVLDVLDVDDLGV